jgi:alpha-tubulin suppressor-like RCC1 family protein
MLAAVFLAGMIAVPAANPGSASAAPGPAPVTRAAAPAPASVVPTLVATAIALGAHFACALIGGGSVNCWGGNSYGQLGDGTTVPRPVPVAVSGISKATAVATGGLHTCALIATGGVECWGYNAGGQLGDNSTTNRSVPGPVDGISTAVAVSGGLYHTCALLSSGSVECWGYNYDGQLGDGSMTHESCPEGDCSTTPVTVIGISTAVAIDAGDSQTCAVLVSGTIKCWGGNWLGQLGDGNMTHQSCLDGDCSTTPVTVAAITTAAGVAAGSDHTCAVLAGGAVNCWGGNWSGQLGDGTTHQSCAGNDCSPTPVAASGISTATAVAAGMDHSCALLTSGSVDCWGGQFGDPWMDASPTPVPVSGISTATAVAGGLDETCVRLADGSVYCWGNNCCGQLGDGTYADSSVPVQVLAPDTTPPTGGDAPLIHVVSALSTGSLITSLVPVPLTWPAAADDLPFPVSYEVQSSANGGLTWTNRTLADPTAASATVALPPSVNRVRVRASDQSGNKGAWFARAVTIRLAQENAAAVHYGGGFSRVHFAGSSGGYVKYASAAGRSASYTASGRVFALVSTKAKARGKARVYVNGVYQGTIDLYASSTQAGRVVWRRTFTTSGTRTIRVVLTGTKRAAATSTRVDIDAFVVLK